MEEQVILQLSDFFKYFIVNPAMIFGYLNDFFGKKYNSMLFIEEIQDGFLFVFKDFESFKKRASPLSNSDLKEQKSDNTSESIFFQKFFNPKQKFPKEGITVEVKIISGNKIKIIPIIKIFVQSISKNINIEIDNEQNVILKIHDFVDIKKYANSLMNRYYKT